MVVYSSNNTLLKNTLTNNGYSGITLSMSTKNTLQDNIANNNSKYGIYLVTYSAYNFLFNNTANNNSYCGLHFLNFATNNNLTNNTANGNAICGINLKSSNDNKIIGSTIINNLQNGIQMDSSTNITIRDSLISNSNWSDLSLTNSSANLTNTTFDKSKAPLFGVSNISVGWYLTVEVTSGGAPLSGATVNVTSNNSTYVLPNDVTDANGKAVFVAREYLNTTPINYTDFNPYNITITKLGYESNNTTANVISNMIVQLSVSALLIPSITSWYNNKTEDSTLDIK